MAAEHTEGASWVTVAGLLPVAIAAALFVGFATLIPTIAAGEAVRLAWTWVPALEVDLSFYIDGLALTFALLISGIGILVMLFSASYLAGHPQQGRFSLYLTSFMLAMLGLVLADNMIALFVFWELTSVTSFLLISFSHTSAEARRCAIQALLVTAGGGLALLAGILILGEIAGTYELSQIRASDLALTEHPLYLPILILFLLGAFTKSAQVPFHFWLPNAMAAPTPVSAFLHSATMVKGGVYLLARIHPSFSGTDVWLWTLVIFGAVTTVFASVVAIRQTDLKQTLAYTTLMALGALVLFLAPGSGYAPTAAATFLVVHSLYKAALFLMIGCVDHSTGTRDARRLGGLVRRMPVSALSGGLAALSMAGLMPFIGFIGKELLYKAGIESPASPVLVTGAIFLASALMFCAAGMVAFKPFWGSGKDMPDPGRPIREAPWPMLAGPAVLGALSLYFGLQPLGLEVSLIAPTVASITGDIGDAEHLHLWTGVNLALILSGLTFALGFVFYLFHGRLRETLLAAAERQPDCDRGWDRLLASTRAGARALTGWMQSGVLNRYLVATFATMAIGIGTTAVVRGLDLNGAAWSYAPLQFLQMATVALIIVGTAVPLVTNSRIAAIAGLGVVGIGVALVFIQFSAPDVAVTQLLVEMLVVVLFAVAALKLPLLPPRQPVASRPVHAIVAIGLGAAVTAVMLGVLAQPIDLRLTEYFEIASFPDAFGRNIVNVILVDFRALDTFGEIAVVGIAGISALALLKQTSRRDRT